MSEARDITQLCCSSNLAAVIAANKIEQSFHSVYSFSRIESIERVLGGTSVPNALFVTILLVHHVYP